MKNIICPDLQPRRSTIYSAGYDLFINEDIKLFRNSRYIIDTGVVLEDNDFNGNYVGLVFPRSSYGFKYGLRFDNSIGVIDSDYRDTIKLAVRVDEYLELKKGDRIAQIIFMPWMCYAKEQKPTIIRNGGIGSTGQ